MKSFLHGFQPKKDETSKANNKYSLFQFRRNHLHCLFFQETMN